MYYYIVDPPRGVQTAKIVQRLQELVTPLGISGEISIATPARSAEELAYMGVDKGYTTIIAVGGEALANTVATILQNESREKIAFGIIPLDAGSLIPSLIGVANNDIRRATEVIKQRHLDLVNLVQVASKQYMFTEAMILAPRKVKMTLEIDQKFKVVTVADFIHISRDLVLTVQSTEPQTVLQKTLSFLRTNNSGELLISQFHGQQVRLVAHEPLPVMIANQVVAKTPTTLTKIPAALKLITTRAILPARTISDLPARVAPNSNEVSYPPSTENDDTNNFQY